MPRQRHKKPPASLLTFPATLTLRAMGHNQPGFAARVLAALQICQPVLTEAALNTRPSREGKYLAISITLTVQSQGELDAIYQSLRSVKDLILAV